MKVLKFGGTSVGSVESILSLKKIVEKEAKEQSVIVVVSALGGITDKLLATSRMALAGDERYRDEFEAIVDRHHKMIDTIITDTKDREKLFNTVDALLEQLRSIYFGEDAGCHRGIRRASQLKYCGYTREGCQVV